MMQVVGYCLSVLIGLSLGLIGGGGAILTIPVLVFFFDIEPETATTYSLFIVGITAISGSINHYRIRNIDYLAVFLFGIPSVIVLFVMRRYLIKQIPAIIFQQNSLVISKPLFIMIVFSIVMLIAGLLMIKKKSYTPSKERQNISRLVTVGCITGAITGFIGIGGGFIIVPSLVLFAGLPMKKAIGTSLTIITINCLVGILGNLDDAASLDYFFLSTFSSLAIIGILLGTWLIRFIPDKKLKPILGWLILGMSIVVFIRIFAQY
jgi:uncharacterized membrane protein YfcA